MGAVIFVAGLGGRQCWLNVCNGGTWEDYVMRACVCVLDDLVKAWQCFVTFARVDSAL